MYKHVNVSLHILISTYETILHFNDSEQADLFFSLISKELNDDLRWETNIFTNRLSDFF